MSKPFYIKTDELLNLALKLQQINGVALPFAVQNTLNKVARHVKTNTLEETTNELFEINKRTFFKANSGYKTFQAKNFGYNINRLKAEVGITKSTKPYDSSTEQVGSQETGQDIKRSINPLGEKTKPKSTIDILSHKPEIYDSNTDRGEFVYLRKVEKAYRSGTGVIFAKGNRGALRKVTKFQRRKATKRNPFKYDIKTKPIASYIKGGHVKLTKKRPFLTMAVKRTMDKILEETFYMEAERQIWRAMNRK